MLYDPKWEKPAETKVDLYSLAGVIAWLEKQPPSTAYEFMDCGGACLVGQYYIAMGVHNKGTLRYRPYLAAFGGDQEAYGYVCASHPYTLGAALERARAWQRCPYSRAQGRILARDVAP